jgi:hypothetical protein
MLRWIKNAKKTEQLNTDHYVITEAKERTTQL